MSDTTRKRPVMRVEKAFTPTVVWSEKKPAPLLLENDLVEIVGNQLVVDRNGIGVAYEIAGVSSDHLRAIDLPQPEVPSHGIWVLREDPRQEAVIGFSGALFAAVWTRDPIAGIDATASSPSPFAQALGAATHRILLRKDRIAVGTCVGRPTEGGYITDGRDVLRVSTLVTCDRIGDSPFVHAQTPELKTHQIPSLSVFKPVGDDVGHAAFTSAVERLAEQRAEEARRRDLVDRLARPRDPMLSYHWSAAMAPRRRNLDALVARVLDEAHDRRSPATVLGMIAMQSRRSRR